MKQHACQLVLFSLVALAIASCSRPIADFTYSGDTEAPARLEFNNLSEKADEFEWNFGDGTTTRDSSPVHRYLSSGAYLVQLKAIKDNKSKTKEERIVINPPDQCLVELETKFGNMLIHLYEATPKHQENFIKLIDAGFFEDLLFHRVISGFMIQGGDPESKDAGPDQPLGSGGPGYRVPAEFVDSLIHTKGALAAARQGDGVNPEKASSGSQFYIVQGNSVDEMTLRQIESRKGIRYTKEQKEVYLEKGGTPFLDQDYTVFGQVIDGLEVIDSIAQIKTNRMDSPIEDIKMKLRVIR